MEQKFRIEANMNVMRDALPIRFSHNKSMDKPENHVLHLNNYVEIYVYISGNHNYIVENNLYELKQGDIIGLQADKITTKGKKADEVAYDLVKAMVDADTELVTLYYGQDTTEEEANALIERLEEEFEDVEFIVQYGGQPLYYYIISAE